MKLENDDYEDEDEYANGGETNKGFYRLPKKEVIDDVYILNQEVKSISDKLNNGQDVKLEQLNNIIKLSNSIKNKAKRFTNFEQVKGTKYEYANGGETNKGVYMNEVKLPGLSSFKWIIDMPGWRRNQDDFFESILTPFKLRVIFSGLNWFKPDTKSPEANLACPNP